MPRKPQKVQCKPLVLVTSKRTNLPGWGELYDYGMETGHMMQEHGQSKDPAILQKILERCRHERDGWLLFSPPEFAGAAKQCINIEGLLVKLGSDKNVMKAAQDETDRYIELSAPNWKQHISIYAELAREETSKLPSCASCDKYITGHRQFCGQCNIVVYCGAECQREHWAKVHRDQCGKPGCGFCGKVPEKPMKCGKCLQVTYCSKHCQIRDWNYQHKKKCQADDALAQISETFTSLSLA